MEIKQKKQEERLKLKELKRKKKEQVAQMMKEYNRKKEDLELEDLQVSFQAFSIYLINPLTIQ